MMNLTSVFKHIFVPHEGNNHKPHLFREVSVIFVLLLSVFLLGISFGSSVFTKQTVLGASVASSVLIDLANDSRLDANENPLVQSELLTEAAGLKANDMVTKQYFSHVSKDGVTPWHWFSKVGYSFLYAGENLAINFTDSEEINKAWLNSPSHRRNLLDVKFREIGIAVKEGVYNGEKTIFVVQFFGTPVNKKVTLSQNEIKTGETDIALSATSTLTGGVTSVLGESTSSEDILETVISDASLAVVKNIREIQSAPSLIGKQTRYATWYEHMIVLWPEIASRIYITLLILFSLGFAVLLSVEIREGHMRHVEYCALVIVSLVAAIYANNHFF